jgi:hypothetical protein
LVVECISFDAATEKADRSHESQAAHNYTMSRPVSINVILLNPLVIFRFALRRQKPLCANSGPYLRHDPVR